jgi:hypothetical protein
VVELVMTTAEPTHVEGLGVVVVVGIYVASRAANLAGLANETAFADRILNQPPGALAL